MLIAPPPREGGGGLLIHFLATVPDFPQPHCVIRAGKEEGVLITIFCSSKMGISAVCSTLGGWFQASLQPVVSTGAFSAGFQLTLLWSDSVTVLEQLIGF